MPISDEEFQRIDSDGPRIDLSPDTTQGTIYRFLLQNATKAFRQREFVDALDVPHGSVGPTLARLEEHGLVEHRGRYWKIDDSAHAVATATHLGTATAEARDGGFSNDTVETWMETAVEPIDEPEDSEGG